MSWGWYYDKYRPSRRKAAKGGIKSQSQRGSFAKSWWAKRWIAVLEGFQIGARLGRGRSYARQGQVLSITIDKGLVQAKVQGSRTRPYDITIKVNPLSPDEWKRLSREISAQAIFAAKLLAGEMPQDIEKIFEKAGLSLFPERSNDLETDCSCPDWSNPCKHIAAVYYLLGEEFDRDPFLLFKLRGMSREELLATLDQDLHLPAEPGGKKAVSKSRGTSLPPETGEAQTLPPEPLLPDTPVTDLSSFWGGSTLPEDLFGEVSPPSTPATLPKRLGTFPFWQGGKRFLEAIEPIYTRASSGGLGFFLVKVDDVTGSS